MTRLRVFAVYAAYFVFFAVFSAARGAYLSVLVSNCLAMRKVVCYNIVYYMLKKDIDYVYR